MRNFFFIPFLLGLTITFPSMANLEPNQEIIEEIPVLGVNTNDVLKSKQQTTQIKEKVKLTASDYYKKGREAYLQFNSKGYREAIDLFDKALQLDKKYALALAAKAEAQALLSRVIYDLNDEEIIAKLELSAFENAYISIQLEPELNETHRALSMVYFIQKKYLEAKREAEKAIEFNDNDAESYLLLWLNSPDKKILRNDENSEVNYYKSLDLDSIVIDKILEINPDLQLAYLEVGSAYASQNEYFDALACFKKVIKLNPENEDAYAFLGSLYNKTVAASNDAITQFKQALKIEPKRYDAIYGLGIAYMKKRDKVKALEYFEDACNYDYMNSCDLLSGYGINRNPGRTRRWRGSRF
jgi:tetratricopeptide (TPR) repeat protein